MRLSSCVTLLLILVAPPIGAVTFNDGLLHIIDGANSYPSESVTVDDHPIDYTPTSLEIRNAGAIGTLTADGLTAVFHSQVAMHGGEIGGDVLLDDYATMNMSDGQIGGDVVVRFEAMMAISAGQISGDVLVDGDATIEMLGGEISGDARTEDVGMMLMRGGTLAGSVYSSAEGGFAIVGGEIAGDIFGDDFVSLNVGGGIVHGNVGLEYYSTLDVSGGIVEGYVYASGAGGNGGLLGMSDGYVAGGIIATNSYFVVTGGSTPSLYSTSRDTRIEGGTLGHTWIGGPATLGGGSLGLLFLEEGPAAFSGATATYATIDADFSMTSGSILGDAEFETSLRSVQISGGDIFGRTTVGGTQSANGLVEISGGAFHDRVWLTQTTAEISGGLFNSYVTAYGETLLLVLGGSFTSRLSAGGIAEITIVGTNFNLPFGQISATSGPLTGTLLSGDILAIDFSRSPSATITLVSSGDSDGDSVLDYLDNCPADPNSPQTDTDENGVGDACNSLEDTDGDDWSDLLDNCPVDANPSQADADGDLIGDSCDPFPSDPDNEQAQCNSDLSICSSDLTQCSSDLLTSQSDLLMCEADEAATLSALNLCQTTPPFTGDINHDGQVNILDSVLLRRQLAELPPDAPRPGITALRLRDATTDQVIESVGNGDTWSLSDLGDCLAIEIGVNESSDSVRYDWTAPGESEVVAYYSEINAPFCWRGDQGWLFADDVPDCVCDAGDEMRTLGTHTLRLTPCSVNVNFGLGETCAGNGGVEGPTTGVTFTITP